MVHTDDLAISYILQEDHKYYSLHGKHGSKC